MVTEQQAENAINCIKANQTLKTWISEARDRTRTFKALVNGKDFSNVLINEIEKLESKDRAKARQKYSKDIRDMFNRVFKKRFSVFEAVGGSEFIKTDSEIYRTDLERTLNTFKGSKSLEGYLAEHAFNLWDIEPNGLFFVEYETEPTKKVYPTFKSINDIRFYKSNGQLIEFVLFEPKQELSNNGTYRIWRYVDSECDICVKEENTVLSIVSEKSFTHPFKQVPAIIISDHQEVGSEIRISPIDQVSELAKDYARDKSVLTVYKFLNGFPIHWRYVSQCRTCQGSGKTGASKCGTCNGSGVLGKADVTDVVNVAQPREGDPILTPNLAGYINPSIEVWTKYNEDQKEKEELIFHTVWGTKEAAGQNETATGRFIDTQPITNELNRYSKNIEFIHNQLAKMAIRFITNSSGDAIIYHKSYGKRFIIESPDSILERYTESKDKGDPSTILDRILNEYIVSKYRSDPFMLAIQIKKSEIEPYIHWDLTQVFDSFGSSEAGKKILFQEWWVDADYSKEKKVLKIEFESYVKQNKERFSQGEPSKAVN